MIAGLNQINYECHCFETAIPWFWGITESIPKRKKPQEFPQIAACDLSGWPMIMEMPLLKNVNRSLLDTHWVIVVRWTQAWISQIFGNFCCPPLWNHLYEMSQVSQLITFTQCRDILHSNTWFYPVPLQWFLLFFEGNLHSYRQLWLICHCVNQRSQYFCSVTEVTETTFIALVYFLCQTPLPAWISFYENWLGPFQRKTPASVSPGWPSITNWFWLNQKWTTQT